MKTIHNLDPAHPAGLSSCRSSADGKLRSLTFTFQTTDGNQVWLEGFPDDVRAMIRYFARVIDNPDFADTRTPDETPTP